MSGGLNGSTQHFLEVYSQASENLKFVVGVGLSATLPSSGYWVFSQPEICLGDQSRISLLATMSRNFRLMERRQRLGRKADCQASSSA